jgi:hypothetical protein
VVTADRIREAFKAIVVSHKIGMSWISVWTNPLDEETQSCFPACWWGPLSGTVTDGEGIAPNDTFNIDVLFVDQTAGDRSQDERDGAHARMDAVARQCWRRFMDTYINNEGTFDGQLLDLAIGSTPTLSPVWDDKGEQLTGVRLTVTLTAVSVGTCMDEYFNA